MRQLESHNHSYYVLDAPTVSDAEYDKLYRELVAIEETHPDLRTPSSPTQRVGGAPREGFVKVTHASRMYSLDNAYSVEDLDEFDRRVREGLREQDVVQYVAEPKIDGGSLEVKYSDGLLARAATRGDGAIGEDVTQNVRTIRALPLTIADTRTMTLRGEVLMYREDLATVNEQRLAAGEEAFMNARNAASGSLRLLDSQQTAQRPLRVFLYDMVERHFKTHVDMLESIAKLGLPSHRRHRVCNSLDEVKAFIVEFDKVRHTLPYDTDGVVVKINHYDQRDRLGATTKFPRWAIAYKFAAERAATKVIDVSCDLGRTGAITPVAEMEPVLLGGTTVARASLHNYDYVAAKDVRVGDTVWIEKAGEVIPQVLEVIKEKRPKGAKAVVPPSECPVCGTPVKRIEGEAALRCTNTHCKGRVKAAIFYFTRRSAMDIDRLGWVLVEQLVDTGIVQDVADIFALPTKREELIALERMAAKSADNVIAAIDEARASRTFDRLITALGIPLVGTVAAKLIAERYGDLGTMLEREPADIAAELAEIHGIGPKIAESVSAFMDDKATRALLQKLLKMGVVAVQPKAAAPVEGPLTGSSFCVTGVLTQPREQVHASIRDAGGEVHDRVKKGTTYLVAGEKVGQSKLDSAKKHGTKIINEQDLAHLIQS
ncbi:MAG: NAD-dependent DNA ligase LigA [Sandaracinaceae bacterium]|nr:NAD-dependent DNA ligase LigA [Sandaracinaceae bacterium]